MIIAECHRGALPLIQELRWPYLFLTACLLNSEEAQSYHSLQTLSRSAVVPARCISLGGKVSRNNETSVQ